MARAAVIRPSGRHERIDMRRSVVGTLALLVAISAIAGCAPGGATIEATATHSEASSPAPSSQSPAATASPTQPLPDVPALPLMPGAEAVDPPFEPGVIARWTVDAIGPDVYAYYLDALPAAGFVINGQLPGGNAAVIRFMTPDGAAFELTLVGQDDGQQTRISLRPPAG